jgi:hypothetical protein
MLSVPCYKNAPHVTGRIPTRHERINAPSFWENANARRVMPLRRSSDEIAFYARGCHRLQLFQVPAHWWAVGVL